MKILITGSAGFIGFHAAQEFLRRGWDVAGLDNFNDYYSVQLKRARAAQLPFCLYENDICDLNALQFIFAEETPDVVLHLAAQPGVRYSITHPFVSFEESDPVDTPISLYAATKKANELMAHTYAHLYKMQAIGLRFFTVYGPWYRPDMALSLFADAMLHDRPIKVFNHGDMLRDFTYVDDIVDGIVRVVEADRLPLYDIFNIGNHRSEKLMDVIETLAAALGVKPKMEMLPMQAGDVYATYASIDKLHKAVGYEPKTTIREGIPVFAKWYREYYGR